MIWCVWLGFSVMAISIWVINGTSNVDRVNLALAGFAVGFLILVFGTFGTAIAQEHHHPPQDQAIHEEFYSTWMMPDNRAISCCHKMDCAPAEAKQINGQWFARKIEGDMDFTPIPSQKVETERDSPDGRSHLCGREYEQNLTIFCFIPGAGG